MYNTTTQMMMITSFPKHVICVFNLHHSLIVYEVPVPYKMPFTMDQSPFTVMVIVM
jgi:hypothetical protein